jgi:hypothetical protein
VDLDPRQTGRTVLVRRLVGFWELSDARLARVGNSHRSQLDVGFRCVAAR